MSQTAVWLLMTLAGSKELPSGGIIDDQSGNVDVQPSGDAHTRPGGGGGNTNQVVPINFDNGRRPEKRLPDNTNECRPPPPDRVPEWSCPGNGRRTGNLSKFLSFLRLRACYYCYTTFIWSRQKARGCW